MGRERERDGGSILMSGALGGKGRSLAREEFGGSGRKREGFFFCTLVGERGEDHSWYVIFWWPAGDLNRSESILVLGVCCAVVVLFLLSTLIILLLCCFYCTTQKRRSSYDLTTKESPEEFKQQPSLHKNDSGIMTQSGSTNLYGNHYHSHASLEFNNPTAIPHRW